MRSPATLPVAGIPLQRICCTPPCFTVVPAAGCDTVIGPLVAATVNGALVPRTAAFESQVTRSVYAPGACVAGTSQSNEQLFGALALSVDFRIVPW